MVSIVSHSLSSHLTITRLILSGEAMNMTDPVRDLYVDACLSTGSVHDEVHLCCCDDPVPRGVIV